MRNGFRLAALIDQQASLAIKTHIRRQSAFKVLLQGPRPVRDHEKIEARQCYPRAAVIDRHQGHRGVERKHGDRIVLHNDAALRTNHHDRGWGLWVGTGLAGSDCK